MGETSKRCFNGFEARGDRGEVVEPGNVPLALCARKMPAGGGTHSCLMWLTRFDWLVKSQQTPALLQLEHSGRRRSQRTFLALHWSQAGLLDCSDDLPDRASVSDMVIVLLGGAPVE